jgi:hypothetical protein
MAITTLDGAIAGMQPPFWFSKAVTATLVAGRPASLWSLAGAPGAGSFDTTLNGVVLSSSSSQVAGQIRHVDPGSGNAYLARLQAAATQAGTLLLLDRLWHNGGYTITSATAQNSTTPTWPARDIAGSTNGDGVMLALEISAAAGAAAPTITVSYTNQAGTASRTGTNILATANSPAIGATYFIGLQAGDTGVRSVQSLTLSTSWLSGTMNLVAYRVLASLELPGALIPNAIDAITGGMPRLFNGTVPWLVFIPNTTTASNITGLYVETQG